MSNEVKLTAENYGVIKNQIAELIPVMSVSYANSENEVDTKKLKVLQADLEKLSDEFSIAVKNRDNEKRAKILTALTELETQIDAIKEINPHGLSDDYTVNFDANCLGSMLNIISEIKKSVKHNTNSRLEILKALSPYKDSDAEFCKDASVISENLEKDIEDLGNLMNSAVGVNTANSEKSEKVTVDSESWIKPSKLNNRYISDDGTVKFACKGNVYKFTAPQVTEIIEAYEKNLKMSDATKLAFAHAKVADTQQNSVWNHVAIFVNYKNKHVIVKK